jgi:hypothetical protein
MPKKTPLAILVAILISLLAIPANAASRSVSHNTGRAATAYWTQIDGTDPGTTRFGNVHIGYLYAYEMRSGEAWVSAYITDFNCPKGVEPGWGHGDEGGCDYVGDRYGEGVGMALTLDRKLTRATLNGQMQIYGGAHGEFAPIATVSVDVTFSGQGGLARSTSNYRWNDGTSSYSGRFTSQYRSASVSGNIGAMGFDPSLSGGTLESSRSFDMYRGR